MNMGKVMGLEKSPSSSSADQDDDLNSLRRIIIIVIIIFLNIHLSSTNNLEVKSMKVDVMATSVVLVPNKDLCNVLLYFMIIKDMLFMSHFHYYHF